MSQSYEDMITEEFLESGGKIRKNSYGLEELARMFGTSGHFEVAEWPKFERSLQPINVNWAVTPTTFTYSYKPFHGELKMDNTITH